MSILEKKLLLILFSISLCGETFSQIAYRITNSLKYKLQKKEIRLFQYRLKEVESKKWGKIESEYRILYRFQTPILKFETQAPVGVTNGQIIYAPIETPFPLGKKKLFIGILRYSYPLFTGFALSKSIKKAQLEVIREQLKLENLKRELLLKAGELYSSIYQIKAEIWALEKAREALVIARNQAQSLSQEGLIDQATLDGITAQYYQTVASIKAKKAKKRALLNLLSYLLNQKITDIEGIRILKPQFHPNFQSRPDIKVLKKELQVADTKIELVKARYYPQIGVEVGFKLEGENLWLSKNSYRNLDQSYWAVVIKYPIWEGGNRKAQLEEAKIEKLANLLFYKNYLKKVETNYKNNKAQLDALYYQLKAVKAEIKARKSYYKMISGKFKEGLADSSDFTRAVAQLTEARAQKEALRAQIFFLILKLKLDGGEKIVFKH